MMSGLQRYLVSSCSSFSEFGYTGRTQGQPSSRTTRCKSRPSCAAPESGCPAIPGRRASAWVRSSRRPLCCKEARVRTPCRVFCSRNRNEQSAGSPAWPTVPECPPLVVHKQRPPESFAERAFTRRHSPSRRVQMQSEQLRRRDHLHRRRISSAHRGFHSQ